MLPEDMFNHAAGGYGGQSTLCGCLGSCSAMINLVAYDEKGKTHAKMTADLLNWYGQTAMPSTRYDVLASFKNQYQEVPGSPLCHVSVSSWIMKAKTNYGAPDRKDRCSKVTADVVYQTVEMLNAYTAGKYVPVTAMLTKETTECLSCHGKDAENNVTVQQDCLSCHDDHNQ